MWMDRTLVLKYLGYQNQSLDDDMNKRINDAMEAVSKLEGRYIHQTFDIEREEAIIVKGTTLVLEGKSIKHILSQAKQVIVFCATLGPIADQMIMKAAYQSTVDQMILDACASVRIEEILDQMQEDIIGYKTPRFSPGYGDLTIELQRNLLEVIGGRRIGVSATNSSLLMPKKSVTGIIGLSDKQMDVTYRFCDDCLKRTSCDFKICSRE